MSLTTEEKIRKARVQLITRNPFFGSLCLYLNFVKVNEVPTMGVAPDGTIYYNNKFVSALSLEELKAVLCHEILHLALEHLRRLGTRDPFKANIAMDYVVNLMIAPEFQLPKGALLDQKYENMAWEQVYDILPDLPKCPFDCNKCPLTNSQANFPS